MATLTENVQRVVSALNDIKDAIIAKGVTPSGKCETFATAINNIPTGGTDVSDTTAVAGDVLSGKKFHLANGTSTTGSMTNNGKVTPSGLNCGGSYTIPAGYHNGQGVVTANSLSSQTSGTAAAADIANGKTAWVNGSKITGNHTDIDVSDTTAVAGDVLSGKTFHLANGTSTTGSMTNNGKVTPNALNCGGSYTIPAGYHNGQGTVTANSLASQTGVDSGKAAITANKVMDGYQGWVNGQKITGTVTLADLTYIDPGYAAVAQNLLNGRKAWVNGEMITGSMTNNGTISPAPTLNCGASYTIPAGYHSGSTKVTANSLASQTSATATASDIASGKTAYVNGTKLTGTAPRIVTGVLSGAGSTAITITLGWKPKKLITWKCTSTTNTVPTANIEIYDADASTSVYYYTNTSGAVATVGIPNTATNRLNSISDTGFTYKTAAGSTLYYYYIAIG